VVTVSGPRADMVTRRKERRLGIWVNVDSRQFVQVPTYLAVFSSRPVDEIAPPDVRRRQQLGLNDVLLPQRIGPDVANVVASDPFRSAFVRLRTEHGLYREQPRAVTFLTPTLFRTGIPLPAEVAIGTYDVDIKLFAGGALLAACGPSGPPAETAASGSSCEVYIKHENKGGVSRETISSADQEKGWTMPQGLKLSVTATREPDGLTFVARLVNDTAAPVDWVYLTGGEPGSTNPVNVQIAGLALRPSRRARAPRSTLRPASSASIPAPR